MRITLVLGLTTLLMACGGKTLEVGPADDSGTGSDTASDSAATDSGVPVDWTSCTGPGQCALIAKTCCGSCGSPTTADMFAVRKGNESKYRDMVCGPVPPGCPECAPYIADDSLQAWCQFGGGSGGGGAPAGKCTAIDVRTETVSACATDDDCILRHSSCCEPCEERRDDLVALGRSSVEAYRSKVCVGDETCYRCMSRYPVDARARCEPKTKHCVVEWLDMAGGG